MIVFVKIKDGRKNYKSRKKQETKIAFQNDGFYKCLGRTMWVRYSNYEFRIEEIYYFLGFRESITTKYGFIDFKIIINRIISVVKKDFVEVLKDAQKYYNSDDNFMKFYDWSCGR